MATRLPAPKRRSSPAPRGGSLDRFVEADDVDALLAALTAGRGVPEACIKRKRTGDGEEVVILREPGGRDALAVLDPRAAASGLEDAIRRATAEGAEYLAVPGAAGPETFRVGNMGARRTQRGLPHHPAGIQHPLPRSAPLPPWRREHELRETIRRCHTELFTEMSKDPAAAFDEILRLLVTKIYDEREGSSTYEFYWDRAASDEENARRIRALHAKAAEWAHSAVAAGLDHGPERVLSSARALRAVVQALENHSILETAASTDVQGVVYETIVGATFRGELGSYFTPRNIVEFMVRLVSPAADARVFDISCGSGGFLIGSLDFHREHAMRVYGVDINPRMVKAARLNLLLHGQEPTQILHGHGLRLVENLRKLLPGFDELVSLDAAATTYLDQLREGPFDVVLANPPFAGHEKEEDLLQRVKTASWNGRGRRSLNRTLPFVEAIVASLKIGGTTGMVLPISILNAEEESFAALREVVLAHTEVVAIVDLPRHAFTHTDCGVEGALLFLKRVRKPRKSYPVFVARAQHLGYDRLGKPTRENDLPGILAAYRAASDAHLVPVSELRAAGRWDPVWLLRQKASKGESARAGFVPLTSLVRVRRDTLPRSRLDDEETYRYFEVGDCDINTGQVKSVKAASGFELKKKNRIKQVVHAGDILLPNHRDSLIAKTADTAGRSVVRVPPELDGVFTTDRFLMLEPLCDPHYLEALLNSKAFRARLVPHSRGSASLDLRPTVLERVLVPDPRAVPGLPERLRDLASRERQLRDELEAVSRAQHEAIESLFGRSE